MKVLSAFNVLDFFVFLFLFEMLSTLKFQRIIAIQYQSWKHIGLAVEHVLSISYQIQCIEWPLDIWGKESWGGGGLKTKTALGPNFKWLRRSYSQEGSSLRGWRPSIFLCILITAVALLVLHIDLNRIFEYLWRHQYLSYRNRNIFDIKWSWCLAKQPFKANKK